VRGENQKQNVVLGVIPLAALASTLARPSIVCTSAFLRIVLHVDRAAPETAATPVLRRSPRLKTRLDRRKPMDTTLTCEHPPTACTGRDRRRNSQNKSDEGRAEPADSNVDAQLHQAISFTGHVKEPDPLCAQPVEYPRLSASNGTSQPFLLHTPFIPACLNDTPRFAAITLVAPGERFKALAIWTRLVSFRHRLQCANGLLLTTRDELAFSPSPYRLAPFFLRAGLYHSNDV